MNRIVSLLVGLLCLLSISVFAQEDTTPDSIPPAELGKELRKARLDPDKMTSEEKTEKVFEALDANNVEEVEKFTHPMLYYAHDEEGETALTRAILQKDVELVGLLVEKAVINLKNEAGETPLTLAIRQGNKAIIELVLERAKAGLKNDHDQAPLWLAIGSGDLPLITQLIEKGAQVNRKSMGITPIYQAVSLDRIQELALLIKYGGNPSLPNNDGAIPLTKAVIDGNRTLAGILLNKSLQPASDANWRTQVGEPLLSLAVRNQDEAMIRLLLRYGASVNAGDHLENTGLHIAAELGYQKIAELLLENGADPNRTNIIGDTPVQVADQQQQTGMARFLRELTENSDSRLVRNDQ